jgi:hypothetical protein
VPSLALSASTSPSETPANSVTPPPTTSNAGSTASAGTTPRRRIKGPELNRGACSDAVFKSA